MAAAAAAAAQGTAPAPHRSDCPGVTSPGASVASRRPGCHRKGPEKGALRRSAASLASPGCPGPVPQF